MSIIISKELKESIVADYKSKPQTKQVMKEKYGLCVPTISKILEEYNVPTYTKQQLYSYGLNENIFENIDNEIKAYFLGLLMADGCIFVNNRSEGSEMRVILELAIKDEYIVEAFHSFINAQTSLRYGCDTTETGEKIINTVLTSVTSNKMANDLMFWGVKTPKPLRRFPVLYYRLIPHFLRGYFDGDGCFSYRLGHPERKVCNSYRGKISIVAHGRELQDIEEYCKYIGISHWYNEHCNSNLKDLFMLGIERKDDIVKFYNFIYSEANIYMIRKKEKFEEFFRLNNMI